MYIQIFKKIGLSFLAIFLAILCAELYLRVVHPQGVLVDNGPVLTFGKDLSGKWEFPLDVREGYQLGKNYWYRDLDGKKIVWFNRLWLEYNSTISWKENVAFIGDSLIDPSFYYDDYTMKGKPLFDMYNLLSREDTTRSYQNFAIQGTNIEQEVLAYRTFVEPNPFDTVVYVAAANDIYYMSMIENKLYYTPDITLSSFSGAVKSSPFSFFLGNSYLAKEAFRVFGGNLIQDKKASKWSLELDEKAYYQHLIERYVAYVRDIAARASQKGQRFFVILAPTNPVTGRLSFFASIFDKIEQELKKDRIAVYNLYHDSRFLDEKLFIDMIHFSRSGHRLYAEYVKNLLDQP